MMPYIFKNKIYKILCIPVIGKLIGTIFKSYIPNIRNLGTRYYMDKNIVSSTAIASLFWGFYENAELQFIQKYYSGGNVIELGASAGVVSRKLGQLLHVNSKLICVEANTILLENIKRNLSEFKEKKIFIENFALSGGTNETIDFYIAQNNVDSSLAPKINSKKIKVKTTGIINLVRKYDLQDFSLICDIEGAEVFIIKEESNWHDMCQNIIIELHENDIIEVHYTIDMLVKSFEKLGFKQIDRKGNVFYFTKDNHS